MSQDPLFILVILSMAVVLVVLMIGIGGFGRGGEFNRKYANKLMFKNSCSVFSSRDYFVICVFKRIKG